MLHEDANHEHRLSVLHVLTASRTWPYGPWTPVLPASDLLLPRLAGTLWIDRDRLPWHLRWLQSAPGVGRPLLAWTWTRLRPTGRELRGALATSPDLVHAHSVLAALELVATGRGADRPIVVTVSSADVSAALASESRAWLLDRVGEHARLAVVESRRTLGLLSELGWPSERIRVVPPAVVSEAVAERWAPLASGGPVSLVACAPLVERSGLPILLEAFSRAFPDGGRPVRLRIAGSGPLLPALRAHANDLGIGARVDWLGRLAAPDLCRELTSATASVFAPHATARGDREPGIPTGLSLALALGCPIVATRHGLIDEVLQDGENASLAEERDVLSLASSLERIVADPALAARLARGACESARVSLSASARFDALAAVYREALGIPAGPIARRVQISR